MKKALLFLVAAFVALFAVQGFEYDDDDPVQLILLSCGDPDGPTPADELIAYAKGNGWSNEKMSAHLVELVKLGLDGGEMDNLQRQLAEGALWMLPFFGGEKEYAFVREIMRTSQDGSMLFVAMLVGMRIKPEKWEEWVREVVADKRFGGLMRFSAYEEAYRIGQNGPEATRLRVMRVLSEFAESDAENQSSLQRWVEKLKALGNAAGEEE